MKKSLMLKYTTTLLSDCKRLSKKQAFIWLNIFIRKQVFLIYHGSLLGENNYPAELAQYISDQYRFKGVELLPGEPISADYYASCLQAPTSAGPTFFRLMFPWNV